ncbi:MAG: HIT family protein [Victivallales bacterium]|nr:HIT family protein [Victivallales bacterium]
MPLVNDCVFCKILRGEIPNTTIYEDDMVLAFLDIAPYNLGHTVIIPKTHCVSSTELDPEYLCAMIKVAPKIGAAVLRATKAEGFHIVQNNGRAAGQTVPHVHFHVMPRFAGDGVIFSSSGVKYDSPEAMQELASKVRTVLAK